MQLHPGRFTVLIMTTSQSADSYMMMMRMRTTSQSPSPKAYPKLWTRKHNTEFPLIEYFVRLLIEIFVLITFDLSPMKNIKLLCTFICVWPFRLANVHSRCYSYIEHHPLLERQLWGCNPFVCLKELNSQKIFVSCWHLSDINAKKSSQELFKTFQICQQWKGFGKGLKGQWDLI